MQKTHGMRKIECVKKVAKKYGVPVTYPTLDLWYREDARKKKNAVSVEKKVCPKCGKSMPEDDFMFCPFCGSKLETEKEHILRNAENVVNMMSLDKGNEAVTGIILDLVKYVKEH